MKPVFIDLACIEPGSEPTLITATNPLTTADLPAAITPEGHIVSCWRFTDDERRAIASGSDLYLFIRTSGNPVQPVSLVIGPARTT